MWVELSLGRQDLVPPASGPGHAFQHYKYAPYHLHLLFLLAESISRSQSLLAASAADKA